MAGVDGRPYRTDGGDTHRGFTTTKQALDRLDQSAADQALGRLRHMLVEHLGADGVWFDSSAWIVTAGRQAKDQPDVLIG